MGRRVRKTPSGPRGKATVEPRQMTTLPASPDPVNLDSITPADRLWWAGLNTEAHSDEPTPVEVLDAPAGADGWGPDDVVELGPDPEMSDADWDALFEERWEPTGFPNDWDNCPGGIG